MAEVASVMGWAIETPRQRRMAAQRARRWLKREGALVKKGRYWYTTRQRLRAAFPEVLDRLDIGDCT